MPRLQKTPAKTSTTARREPSKPSKTATPKADTDTAPLVDESDTIVIYYDSQRGHRMVPRGATVLDCAFLLGAEWVPVSEFAPCVRGAQINGVGADHRTVVKEGDWVEIFARLERPRVKPSWLSWVRTRTARESIARILNLSAEEAAAYEWRPQTRSKPVGKPTTTVEKSGKAMPAGAQNQKKTPASTPDKTLRAAKQETTAPANSVQANRIGKKLMGAYIDEEDAARLKALLKDQGTTVQDFFAAHVAKALATVPAKPPSRAQRERRIEEKVQRYRDALRSGLK